MDVMHACRCCLRCAPDRDLTTPYTHLGQMEIYTDMLKECFDLHLAVGGDGSCGICSACAGRLRDARDFKLQVQRSQAELRARQTVDAPVKEEVPAVKLEMEDGDSSREETASDVGLDVQLEMTVTEMEGRDRTCSLLSHEVLLKPKLKDEDEIDTDASPALDGCAAPPKEQTFTTCSVKAERLDEAPHASHTSLATLHESRRASRVKETHDNTAGRSAEEAYTCDTCGKHFTGKSSLVTHVRRHRAQDEFPNNNLKSIITRKKKPYRCEECNKSFTRTSNLKRHMSYVHDNHKKIYSCDQCNMLFSTVWNLDRHKKNHSEQTPHTCEECNKQFSQQKYLIAHRKLHAGKRPYKCSECKKRFSEKSKLTIHTRIHSGEKPYSCSECNKLFSQKGHLDEHKRIHTGEKPYKCLDCSKSFSAKYNLKRHIQVHSKFANSVILGL